LVEDVNGHIKQVGSTCLADFVGHKDPHGLAAMAEGIAMLDEFAKECEGYDPDALVGGDYWINPKTFLAWTCKVVREHGWLSRSKAVPGLEIPTADRAAALMFNKYPKDSEYLSDDDRSEAKVVQEWAREHFDPTRGNLNDYEWNMAMVLDLESVKDKHFGLLASAVPAYHREQERIQQAKTAGHVDEYVGEIKKRRMWKNLTVEAVITSDGYYGASHLHKMRDPDGHLLVWFSSNFRANVGDILNGKGTVKAHQEYRGVKQTVLTRCKFEVKEN